MTDDYPGPRGFGGKYGVTDERQAGLREALVPLIDECYQRGLDAPEAADFIVAALAVAQVPAEEERLDEAWAEAEAALPAGWAVEGVVRDVRSDADDYGAAAGLLGSFVPFIEARGDTPAAALRALAGTLATPSAQDEGTP